MASIVAETTERLCSGTTARKIQTNITLLIFSFEELRTTKCCQPKQKKTTTNEEAMYVLTEL